MFEKAKAAGGAIRQGAPRLGAAEGCGFAGRAEQGVGLGALRGMAFGMQKDCFEKRELVEKLRRTLPWHPPQFFQSPVCACAGNQLQAQRRHPSTIAVRLAKT